tara:strand:+ start:238 stop:471 length:234 start_codon:yes stop_codon:yes gene_type:complete
VADVQPHSKKESTVNRFTSCRWHATQDNAAVAYCSHGDVLPYAGVNGFKSEAWCPECKFFKLRRTIKKSAEHLIDSY